MDSSRVRVDCPGRCWRAVVSATDFLAYPHQFVSQDVHDELLHGVLHVVLFGGTGSGLESVCLWNILSTGCRKRPKLSFSVLARTQIATPIVEQYNTVLRALLA